MHVQGKAGERLRSKHVVAGLAVAALAIAAAACVAFRTVGHGTLGSTPADVLVVFGSPADISGAPLPMQLWRVQEGVAEYRRGKAPYLLLTGGPAANPFVESAVMARQAVNMGVPSMVILTETHSTTTVENIRGVATTLQAHGWTHAELISSADHLPRIAVLLRGAPFQWRLHTAPTPGRGRCLTAAAYAEEALAVLVLRVFGSAAEPVVHAFAVCEHWIVFLPKYAVYSVRQHLGR